MAMNNQSIESHVKEVVSNAVAASIKKRFVPKVEKYLKRVENCINSESIGDVHISFYYNSENLNKGMSSSIVVAVTGLLIGIPILGAIIGVVAAIVSKFKKRNEQKKKIRAKLQTEIFPQVLQQVGKGIENAITEQVQLVNSSINDEIGKQRETLEKAMADVKSKMDNEKSKKENLEMNIKNDLERIEAIKDGLR
jgi:gas vesicle protein